MEGVVSVFLRIVTLGKRKPEPERLTRMEFRTSGQKMGLRFTERLRDRWRKRWLKLKRSENE